MSITIVNLATSSPPSAKENDDAILEYAIDNAQLHRVRETLITVCSRSAEASSMVKEMLLIRETAAVQKIIGRDNVTEEDDMEDDEDDDDGDSKKDSMDNGSYEDRTRIKDEPNDHDKLPGALKRMRSRYATCEHCSEEFDVTDNGEYECLWHPGARELDPSSETWCDWDEGCEGDREDQEDEYPEGFYYTCCERPGDSEGCKIGNHVEEQLGKAKRMRISSLGEVNGGSLQAWDGGIEQKRLHVDSYCNNFINRFPARDNHASANSPALNRL